MAPFFIATFLLRLLIAANDFNMTDPDSSGTSPGAASTAAPRIVDPRASRIVMVDALPPIAAADLTGDAIRRRFAAPPQWTPELPGDGGLLPGRKVRDAAVLIGLVARPAGLTVLLTQRTAHLHDHAGQISFPGGRRDDGDADLVATALRETHEEVGLAPAAISVLGALAEYRTVTAYRVMPYVALVQPDFTAAPDPFEVAEVFEVPLAFLMDPRNHQRRAIDTPLGERSFYAMPYDDAGTERFVWGATAAMLRNFYRFLAA
jgi:8-oxo-dGTP pyrophosphatase MutT (NUDIX family)